jgi:hypothetical protein
MPWPPEDTDEKARLAEHRINRCIYNNLHTEIFPKFAAYLRDKADDDKKIAIVLGWGEKATSNYINLTIGEEPYVEIADTSEVIDSDKLEALPNEEVLIDASRYGLGLYEITQDGIFAQNPETCYLVTSHHNIRKVTHYVFFHEFKVGTTAPQEFVKFTIYGTGFIQHLIYEIKNGKLAGTAPVSQFPAYADLVLDAEGKQLTGVDLLIVGLDNALSSDRYYGRSDYTPSVVSLIEALELAFSRREEVLAKFARPIFMAPESAFNHFNHAKQVWEIRTDGPLMVEPGSVEAKYLTWQAELGAVENAIKDKMDQLLQMMDLVKQEELGQATSGTALAFRLLPTRARVRKFSSSIKKAIPKVLSLKSKLDEALQVPGVVAFEPSDVTVTMYDGIPSDPKETADINSVIANSLALLVTAKILSAGAALRAAYDAGIVNPLPGMSIDDSILVIGKETQDTNQIQGTVF